MPMAELQLQGQETEILLQSVLAFCGELFGMVCSFGLPFDCQECLFLSLFPSIELSNVSNHSHRPAQLCPSVWCVFLDQTLTLLEITNNLFWKICP